MSNIVKLVIEIKVSSWLVARLMNCLTMLRSSFSNVTTTVGSSVKFDSPPVSWTHTVSLSFIAAF